MPEQIIHIKKKASQCNRNGLPKKATMIYMDANLRIAIERIATKRNETISNYLNAVIRTHILSLKDKSKEV